MDSRFLSLALIGIGAALTGCFRKAPPPPPAPPRVEVIDVRPETMPVPYTSVGRSLSSSKVDIVPRVTGILVEAPFTDGSKVNAGDVLYRIDPAEYRARLDEAEARLAQMKARLVQAEADYAREEPLAAAGAASRQALDAARTAVLSAKADMKAAESAVTNARITLGYTTVRAPISGRTGKTACSIGTLLSPQFGTLLVIDDMDTMFVEFSISEKEMLAFRREIESGALQSVGIDKFVVKATLLDGSEFKETGYIDFTDVHVTPETGTALLRAKFPNPEGKMRPGQFVRVRIEGVTRRNAILVPQSAVVQGASGASVYVVKPDGTAESRAVKLGAWSGDRWHIIEGLKAGDRVVTEGVQRVRAGAKVEIAPPAEAAADATKPAAAGGATR